MGKFVTTVLAQLNKSEDVKQQELVEQFVEDSTIEVNQQIATLETSVIPGLKLKLQRAEKALQKKEKALETARFSTASNFEAYLQNREDAKDNVTYAEETVAEIKSEIKTNEEKLQEFKSILEDFTS
jgi:CRISPR/Cas system CSM-associated protein Csm4 (group 5 of RAMP superfamily)